MITMKHCKRCKYYKHNAFMSYMKDMNIGLCTYEYDPNDKCYVCGDIKEACEHFES